MAMRPCSSCRRNLSVESYSNNQWSKGVGASRCNACVHSGEASSSTRSTPTARENVSCSASFTHESLDHPFASGAFRWVAKGIYTEGERNGQDCVCKWFKTGIVFDVDFYRTDIKTMDKSISIIDQFNAKRFVNRIIQINRAAVWTFTDTSGSRARSMCLIEPFIQGYQKFNSNSGWADNNLPWPKVMQALSHYSYHCTSGQLVICDLQGGVYSDGVVLTDPVILSRSIGEYGVTDLGPDGISTFFARHVCNEFCRADWTKPSNARAHFPAREGTSMMNVPTRNSRPTMSLAPIYDDY